MLDQKPKRRYRRRMIRLIDLKEIPGSVIREARQARGWTVIQLATQVHTTQQSINRIERGETLGGTIKARIVHLLGLQLPRDNGTITISRVTAVVPGPLYDLPLFNPRAGEGGYMVVPKEASAQIRRPLILADADEGYAIKMIGNTMVPRFRHNDTLYANPALKPEDDKERAEYVFYSPDRRTAIVRQLLRQTAEHWVVAQYNPPKETTLLKKAWPKGERIVSANFLESI